MSRYARAVTKSRLYDEDHTFEEEAPMLPQIAVDDHEPIETGLLWSDGSPVVRMPNPLGFGRDSEW